MDKIGKFLAKLRREKNMSQEEVGEKLHISRQAISKWESDKAIPDGYNLARLSEVYGISTDEILNGERKSDNTKFQKSLRQKNYLITIVSCMLIALLIFSLYVFSYNKINIYTISGENESISLTDGLFVITKQKLYFYLGNITAENEIKELKLYYIAKNGEEIVSFHNQVYDGANVILYDTLGYNVHFEFNDLNYIIKNLKLKITFNDEDTILDLNLVKDYESNKLFYKVSKPTITEEEQKEANFNVKLKDQIIKTFTKKNDGYIKNITKYSKKISVIFVDDNFTIEINNKQNEQYWTYNLTSQILSYEEYKEDILVSNIIIDYKNNICLDGDCDKYQEAYNNFNDNLKVLN